MKKIIPVIIGILTGITASILLILAQDDKIAHGQENMWDTIVAYGDFFDWNDVFSPSSQGTDLYFLVYDKLILFPEKDALKEVAQKYGLTKDEAQRVIDGSLTPLFNIPERRGAELTHEDTYILANNLRNDFAELSELFELQQEVDVAIAPSEIFANGDLSDSGFDLVHDLSIIEEILFVEVTENTVGDPFGNQLSSPYLPTEDEQKLEEYIPAGTPGAILEFALEEETEESGAVEEEAEESSFIEASEIGIIEIGDQEIDVEVLEEDICPSDDSLSKALDKYIAEKPKESVEEDEIEEVAEETSAEESDEFEGEEEPVLGMQEYPLEEEIKEDGKIVNEEGEILPAADDQWRKSWCSSLVGAGDTGAAAGNTFGEAGFSSLGNFVNSLINQSAGAGAWAQAEGISLKLGICLDVQLVKKRVTSYQPGDSCVMCEIEKINQLMDKTLSHSLIPNKATGNLMETAKCKDSYGTLLDMQFISIAAPVSTPSKDDAIFGKNIFEEWKKFVDRYQPLLFPEPDKIIEQQFQSVPENVTQEKILQSVNSVLARKRTEAKLEIENTKTVNEGTNKILEAQTILEEIRQMKNFFDGYKKQYEKINKELCPKILSKKDI
ncbi:hypothetical protein GF366_00215 [Candidatus Peregrinibacteria bacterium]|nr:hypothetical protein [Candidatus Peregrinibacteria bacterium]